MKIAIIGGGAAGFFAALSCKQHHPDYEVSIYEKSSKLLSKVKVSGGGRCNVTNSCEQIPALSKNYPRGEKFLKKAFSQFKTTDTVDWFEARNVPLKAENDNRMFPASNNSQSIIDCLLTEANKSGIKVKIKTAISSINKSKEGFELTLNKEKIIQADKVIVASGGSPKTESYDWLRAIGHNIIPPAPSLFTFNMPSETIKSLMGVVVPNAIVSIQSSKFQQTDAVLITHWGMSGPAVLKLSAYAARHLQACNYHYTIRVNWVNQSNEEVFRNELNESIQGVRMRKISNTNPLVLPNRMWEFLLHKSEIDANKTWAETGKKQLNKLINTLLNDVYEVKGKTTFKEEFVTCGGVMLSEISSKTMMSNICENLYFAGEVMDIDGITGGFNFQAAWTTGYIAGKLI